MDEKDYSKHLVERYLSNIATQQEVEAFLHLSASGKLEHIITEHMERDLEAKATIQAIPNAPRKFGFTSWARIAATILAVILGVVYFYNREESKTEPRKVAHSGKKNNTLDVRPGSNKATLTLENGATIILGDSLKGIIARQTASIVNMPDAGIIAYSQRETSSNDRSITYNTITTPRGGQYKVILPDGSKVWLNADSYLKYPTFFSGKERKVELKGEGYFEIAHDATAPFTVLTGSHRVTVLGTHFNINAYADEQKIQTTLLEGKVAVSDASTEHTAILLPGYQSQYEKKFTIVKADIEEVLAWKNGYFLFINENIESVLRKVSRWYDVDIIYADDVSKKALWGSVSKFENVSEILKVLELTRTVQFELEDNKIVVKKAK